MTQARLIKRTEVMNAVERPRAKETTKSARSIVKEWLAQHQEAKPRNAHATFAALFTEPQLG